MEKRKPNLKNHNATIYTCIDLQTIIVTKKKKNVIYNSHLHK